MPLTLTQIEALAPDQASLTAAGKLLKPSAWPLLARDAHGGVAWGEAQGSGSAPYRVCFATADRGSKCTCPSRKFPCKHVLALMWRFADRPDLFPPDQPPAWVTDWLARRRPAASPGTGQDATLPAKAEPASLARATAESAIDSALEAQSAARRGRSQAAREAALADALETLDTWIGDQLREGLATFPQRAKTACRAMAQRLVDGKAAGLALLLDELPSTLFGLADPLRPDFLVAELARLHLVAAAYRRQDALPEPLRADVRRTVGWVQKREELLVDPAAPHLRCRWTAIGSRTAVQADKLRRVETWLVAEDGERAAVLVEYAPAGVTLAPAFARGERFEGELVFYPSAAPLRAMVAQRGPSQPKQAAPPARLALPQALAAYQARLAALPWLVEDLVLLAHAELAEIGGSLWLVDGKGGAGTPALPLAAAQGEAARPLLGMALASAAAIWDGRVATLLAAGTALGPWWDGR